MMRWRMRPNPQSNHRHEFARPRPGMCGGCLLVGVAVGYLLHPGAGGSIDRAEVTGAMLTPTEQLESAPIEILIEGGSVVASRAGSDVVVDLKLTSDIELGLTLMGTGGPVRMTNLAASLATAIWGPMTSTVAVA